MQEYHPLLEVFLENALKVFIFCNIYEATAVILTLKLLLMFFILTLSFFNFIDDAVNVTRIQKVVQILPDILWKFFFISVKVIKILERTNKRKKFRRNTNTKQFVIRICRECFVFL